MSHRIIATNYRQALRYAASRCWGGGEWLFVSGEHQLQGIGPGGTEVVILPWLDEIGPAFRDWAQLVERTMLELEPCGVKVTYADG